MSESLVQLGWEDSIAILTLNNAKHLNSINGRLILDLRDALGQVSAREDARALILTGAGGKAFAAGADVREMAGMDSAAALRWSRTGQELFLTMERMPLVVIAAINGYALGGGLELALACDIRVATPKSSFGLPEVGLGVIPGFGGTRRLGRVAGDSMAREMLFTGKAITAQAALSCGLVNRLVEESALMESCLELARTVASKSRSAVALCKAAVQEGMEMDAERAMRHESALFSLAFSTLDQREGMQAFLDKRPPDFQA